MFSSMQKYLRLHWSLFLVLFLFLVLGLGTYAASENPLPVSYTVGNRELPIYSVDTSEKKIALSFDAAWVNSKLRLQFFAKTLDFTQCH